MGVNCTIDDDNNTGLDLHSIHKLTSARGYTALVTLVVSCVLFVFAFCNLCRRKYRYHKECNCVFRFFVDYGGNPFFLLALISLLPVVAYCIILRYSTHPYSLNLTDDFCKLPGFFLLWFESSETMALSVFSIYFLVYYIPFHDKGKSEDRTETVNTARGDVYIARVPEVTVKYWVHSLLSVVISAVILIICGAYTYPDIVELADSNFTYGRAGPWCWIKPELAQKDFWFYEEWVYMGISSVTLVASFIFLVCVTRDKYAKYRCCQSIWWDSTILVPFSIFFTYFLLQFAIMAIEYLVRVCENNEHSLWYTYAIGKPLSKILLVAAALQLMSTRYRHGKKKYGTLGNNNNERVVLIEERLPNEQ